MNEAEIILKALAIILLVLTAAFVRGADDDRRD